MTLRSVPVLAGLAVILVAAGAAAFGVPLEGSADAETALAAADIPASYAAAYQAAARSVSPAIPWEILAAIGRVATDHGRRSPYDQVDRDQPPATVYPSTEPPISGAGQGPLLLTPAAAAPPGTDLQDIRVAAQVLARAAAPIEERTWQTLGLSSDVVDDPLDDPSAVRFWSAVLPLLPVAAGIGGGPTLTATSGSAEASSSPSATSSPSASDPAGNPMARFASDLLANLGDAATPAAVAALQAWASGEGSRAAFNPLDTTEDEPGATAYNSNGGDPVRNYPDYQTGLAATVATFAPDGRPAPAYAAVLAALHSGQSAATIEAAVAASPWGTRSFPDPSFAALPNFPGFPGSVPSGPATIVGPVASPPAGPTPVATPSAPAADGPLAVAQAYAGVANPSSSAPGGTATDLPVPAGVGSAAAAVAVAFALAQLGKPYQLGATGPAAYDCSGLVQAAYRAAGIDLPRTTYQQVAAGQPVPLGDPAALQPGDLVFIMGADPEGGLPGHVGMVVAPGEVIDAPYTGAVVRVSALSTWTGQLVAVRRIVGGAA